MTSNYEILATVGLLHEYYADGRCPDFSIRPDAATESLLRGSSTLWRSIGNSLVLLTKVDENGAAARKLPAGAVLRFRLDLEQPRMLNYTNLELTEGTAYFFSNRYQTLVNGEQHLNRAVPAFNAGASYHIGALAAQGGTVYEAIRPVSNNDHAPGATDYWEPRTADQYVHAGDRLPRSDGRLRLRVPPGNSFTIDTLSFNPESEAFDIFARATEVQRFETAVDAIQLDRTAVKPGRYLLRVNGQDIPQLIDPEGASNRSLGLIELWNLADTDSTFSLYRNDASPRGAGFVIRFANRLAIWKYRLRTNAATGISIPGQPGAFIAGPQPLEYRSARPMPLLEQPIRNIQLLRGGDILASKLANPPPERISIHRDGNLSWYCAEMRLNY